MTTSPNPYRGFRFPPEVIEHAVWLYHCFSLSLRDVELILAARGIVVSYESIREWGLRFGQIFANMLKRRRPQPGDKWYMDEVFIRIRGKQHYLWRAVDQHGNVLDILVQSRRNATAAKRFFRKLLKGLRYIPRVIVTTPDAILRPQLRKRPPAHLELGARGIGRERARRAVEDCIDRARDRATLSEIDLDALRGQRVGIREDGSFPPVWASRSPIILPTPSPPSPRQEARSSPPQPAARR